MRHEEKQEKPIENITIDSFPEDQRCIILSGTGGLGKSMMMTHFMVDTIKHNGVNEGYRSLLLYETITQIKGSLLILFSKNLRDTIQIFTCRI